MHTYVLLAAGRRCAIIWRPGAHGVRQTAHYWLTPASLQRIQRIAANGHLVRVYHGQHTFLLQGGVA